MNDFDDVVLAQELLRKLRITVIDSMYAWNKLYNAGRHLDKQIAEMLGDPEK